MKIGILKSVGLTENESKVYLSLLEMGKANSTELSHKAKIHRTNIYDCLNRLIEKGIVSYLIKDNKKEFFPAHPDKLREIIKDTENNLNEAIPELVKIFSSKEAKNTVKIFEGKPGIKTIFEDFIREEKEVLMYGVPAAVVDIMQYFLPQYHRDRINRKIATKAIFNADAKDRMKYINDLKYAKARYLSTKSKSPASTNIYGNKVAIILWSSTPLIIQIESKEIADSYKIYFELMWKIAKE